MDATPDEPRKDDDLPIEAQAEPSREPAAPPPSTPEPIEDATPSEAPADAAVTEAPTTEAPVGEAPAAEAPAPETPTRDAVSADAPTDDAPADAPADAVTTDTPADDAPAAAAQAAEGAAGAAPAKAKKKKKAAKKKAKRRPPPKAPERPLTPEQQTQAREQALTRLAAELKGKPDTIRATLERLEGGTSLAFLARFRRGETGGMDEARLRTLLAAWQEILEEEQRRVRIQALLVKRSGFDDATAERLAKARSVAEMDDLAAPYLPVMASRATVARGQGLQGLADAIRAATDETPLSELAKPFVKLEEGQTEIDPTALDAALGGARDILAEDLGLDAALRANLRDLYRKQGVLTVSARSDKRTDGKKEGGAKNALIGYKVKVAKIPPIKVLAIRRAEKQRAAVASIEPPEEAALKVVHAKAVPANNPHAGFLRAAAEDGYRRILKPLFQNEIRVGIKRRADEHIMEQYERTLRNLLLGPYAGRRRVLGLRPDVMQGHRWCAIDEHGKAASSGTLPHEPTAGREACLTELTDILKTYEISAIAVGTTGGRADALALAKDAAGLMETKIDVAEIFDGGTRALEAMGPVEFENHLTVGAECRGALSLARRFQDPLSELVTIDPKALALGPHMHDVHQGRLRQTLDQVVESCIAHVGVDPNVASKELLERVPGFNRKVAAAFLAWREQAGPLSQKAGLATIEGVGPEAAEQAVGFLRLAAAEDPRDRSQLHPEQYEVLDRMAEQAGTDVATLFADANARKRVDLGKLASGGTPQALLKYALFQATAGTRDPRPTFAQPIPPPEGIDLQALADIVEKRGHIELQGRVIRAAPFGVFVDVGMGVEALIPIPHIGDRPGVDPSTVAPVGAVVTARVLEVEKAKKRLTLSMRRGAPPRGRGPAGRGPGGRPPRGGGRGPSDRGDRRPVGAGARGGDGRGPQRGAGGRPSAGGGRPSAGGGRPSAGSGGPGGGRPSAGSGGPGGGRPSGGPRTAAGQRSGGGRSSDGDRKPGGRFSRGGGSRGRSDGPRGAGGRGRRDDRGPVRKPRTISLAPDEGKKKAPKVDESKMSPEELMQFKLDQMRKKFERPDA